MAERSPPEAHGRHRARAAAVLSVLAVVLAMLALLAAYADRTLLRSGPFADRAASALQSPAVREAVADEVTSALVRAGGGDLAAVRPLIRVVAGGVVQSRPFAVLLRHVVAEAHAVVVRRGGGTAFVNVADAGVLVGGLLERLAPRAAERVRAERVARLLTVHPPGAAREALRIARAVASRAWILALAALGLAAGAVLLARARAVRRLGTGLAIGGLTVATLYLIGGAVIGQAAPTGRGAAARALWSAFLGGLQVQALVLAGAGAVVAAAARAWERAGRERTGPMAARERIALILAPLGGRVGRSVLALAAGVVLLVEPGAALHAIVLAAGLGLLYAGGAGLFRALAQRERTGRVPLPGRRALIPVAIAAVVLAGAVAVVAAGGGDSAPAAVVPATCNGYRALCGRRLDDVVFPATHNSMASVTIPTWLFGQQDGTITDQLEHGIRGLLVDTYYGEPAGDRVRTDLRSLPKRAAAEREIGAAAVKAAEAIRNRLGAKPTGGRGIYLCHSFCEIGSVRLASALDDLRTFLVSHPGEVVIVVNQDEGVGPRAVERAFRDAGLLDLVYRGPLGPFPTLRELIDRDERLVVMAENETAGVSWYHPAFERALQETPYRFTRAEQLTDEAELPESCRRNRGPRSAPLLLVNHWIDTSPVPRASVAARVNAYDVLLRRARACRRIRDRLPNLLAVDFFRRGDVLGVARTLNGVGR